MHANRKSVCVYCGSRPGARAAYAEAARAVGALLAGNGWRLVYGAGDVGLMGEVARAAQRAGGETFGVIPTHLMELEVGKRDLSTFVVTETMHERKKVMFMNADAVVVLPGGAGSLDEFFEAVSETARRLPLASAGELMAEPGRALAAPAMSAVVEVLLRKDDRLYVNDGMYGIFWELRFKAHMRFAARAYRDGEPLDGEPAPFMLYGPTCDASDVLPGEVELPASIRAGDYIEFGQIGAYSLSGRTRFNGLFSNRIVHITSPAERPPA
jgi:predicted Rossmann-fold nucleotide-binding protein